MLGPAQPSAGARLRELYADACVLLPGAFDPLSALLAQSLGAKAVYLSGGAMANSLLGVPDIGLTTLDDIAVVASRACQVVRAPILCDADTGFGGIWNVRQTVIRLEQAGLAGIHIEDQENPKRCGHLDGKSLIPPTEMAAKVHSAVQSKFDAGFLIIARTDARHVEGLEAAIDRAKRYVDSGADAIFPEGLQSEAEFEAFRAAVSVPLLANRTEFGKTPMIPFDRFVEMGYQMVIFPVSSLRVSLFAMRAFYADLMAEGTQAHWLDRMMTRTELYDLLQYDLYGEIDARTALSSHPPELDNTASV